MPLIIFIGRRSRASRTRAADAVAVRSRAVDDEQAHV